MNYSKTLEIVLPVYNEELILESSCLTLLDFIENYQIKANISIVDNGSTDNTFRIAKKIESQVDNIKAFKIKEKGRGRALRFRIIESKCELIAYMDIDLSTNLKYFLDLYSETDKDIVMGSRTLPGSIVIRSWGRAILSYVYIGLVRSLLSMPFYDYQCGFKLFKKSSIFAIVNSVENENWFFDTELVFMAYRNGLKIKEIPIKWIERKKGRVRIIPTIIEDIKGLLRLKYGNNI